VPGWVLANRTGFPFHPEALTAGTDSHKIVGVYINVNTIYGNKVLVFGGVPGMIQWQEGKWLRFVP
jgi:hypothetical protein